jgi:hypothetical protein
MFSPTLQKNAIAGLHVKSPRHFAWQFLAPVSQTLWSSYRSHVVTMLSKQTNTDTSTAPIAETHLYTHTPLRAISLRVTSAWGSLTLTAPEDGDFLELIDHFLQSPCVWRQPELSNFNCAWGWRLFGINRRLLAISLRVTSAWGSLTLTAPGDGDFLELIDHFLQSPCVWWQPEAL